MGRLRGLLGRLQPVHGLDRRAAGLSQEQLAQRAGMSIGPIRKIEQGHGGVRMETLHTLARALKLKTSDLMAAGPPQPVKHDDPNSQNLRELRIALTPALTLGPATAPAGEEPDLRRLSRMTYDNSVLYFGDTYQSIAADLPTLIRAANDAVAYYDSGDERTYALVERSRALNLVGRYLTQIRQFDLAHVAARGAIEDAKAAGNNLVAASGVGGMCWLLVRTERFDEAEDIAVATMDIVEPKIMGATPDEYSTWGGLAMEAAAAAARNNRPKEAKALRKAAGTAAKAVGKTHRNLLRHWSMFGPVTAAMEELSHLDDLAPEWFRHQSSAAITFEEITKKRRTLTTDMREVGAHLGVFA
ncbi:helix-turn-helix domain-containing protein [Streptomyces sp. NPDC102441]|uniref:helix-turn-helix domain-containing protein n=1 Tax=Streptomyces sp. NPDC102441 TaxID=3366176 RepID=UPI00380ABDB6